MTLIPVAVLKRGTRFPLIDSPIPAGHPQDAGELAERIDLGEYLARGSDAILYFKVVGESMSEIGITEGDLLVADCGLAPKNGDVVIAELNGGYTVKKFVKWQQGLYLVPENKTFNTRQVLEQDEFRVCAVVTFIVHRL